MARLCDICMNYNKAFDEREQTLDDKTVVSGRELEQHYCPMYDGHIPHTIYYENGDCEWFAKL